MAYKLKSKKKKKEKKEEEYEILWNMDMSNNNKFRDK
jgi:hypothetical protein